MCKLIRLIPLVIFISPLCMGKNFSIDLAAATGESDNALKTRDNEVSEQQSRYAASLQGNWEGEWARANLQYSGSRETFADDSQEGENYLQGDSFVRFGSSQSMFNLDMRHSRRTLLKEVEDKPLGGNQDEREIFSVTPSLGFALGAKNEVALFAEHSRTRYLETEVRDSDRKTYGVDLLHEISSTDKLRLELSKTESDFVYFQNLDYALETAALIYEVNLRKLSYSLGVGQQKIKPAADEESTNDHYQASVGYKSGANGIRVFYDRSVTDTSFGGGFDLGLSMTPGVDAAANEVSLIDRSSSGVDFQTMAICNRCTVVMGYSEADDHYLASGLDANRRTLSLEFNYAFSNRLNLSLAHAINDQEPVTSNALGDEYKQLFSRLVLGYKFMRNFGLEIFTEREQRRSDSPSQEYTENFTGLSLIYHFE